MGTFKDIYVSVGISTTGKQLKYDGAFLKFTDLVSDEMIFKLRTNSSKHLILVDEQGKY